MATETVGVLEQVVGGSAHVIGWSDGELIAMRVARPPRSHLHLVPIGSSFHFDGMRPIGIDSDSPIVGTMQSAPDAPATHEPG